MPPAPPPPLVYIRLISLPLTVSARILNLFPAYFNSFVCSGIFAPGTYSFKRRHGSFFIVPLFKRTLQIANKIGLEIDIVAQSAYLRDEVKPFHY